MFPDAHSLAQIIAFDNAIAVTALIAGLCQREAAIIFKTIVRAVPYIFARSLESLCGFRY